MWPRFGFDGAIPIEMLDSSFQSAPFHVMRGDRLAKVMASAIGRKWWKQFGLTIEVAFDMGVFHLS